MTETRENQKNTKNQKQYKIPKNPKNNTGSRTWLKQPPFLCFFKEITRSTGGLEKNDFPDWLNIDPSHSSIIKMSTIRIEVVKTDNDYVVMKRNPDTEAFTITGLLCINDTLGSIGSIEVRPDQNSEDLIIEYRPQGSDMIQRYRSGRKAPLYINGFVHPYDELITALGPEEFRFARFGMSVLCPS